MKREDKVRCLLLLQEKIRRQAAVDLHVFLMHYAWPVLQPGTKFADNWHIHSICEHLEAVSRGQIKRLVINLPFRMLKSTIVSQAFPAWEWVTRPHLQYLTASYAKDVATRDAVDSRKIIESGLYQDSWGDKFKMTSDQNVKTRYENDKKGSRVVTATDAAGTGFGGNRIIIDDPVSAMEADSETARTSSVEWWKGTAATRLNNPQEDAIILVHQRLHQEDLTGYVLAEEKGWEHLVLPMRFDPELRKTTILGFKDPRTSKGELLSPQRLGEATVQEMEARLGRYHTDAQLQQAPSGREGSIFKQKDWKFYHVHPSQVASQMDEIIWSWDCAFKAGVGNDFVAGHCIGRKGADKYLLWRVCERMGFSATKSRIENEQTRKPFAAKTIAILIEDKANGPAVIDALEDDVPGLTPITPQGGKTARAHAVQPQHEAGNFYLPSPTMEGFEWVTDFMDLFAKFPGVTHDDDIDAWTQGVNWYTTRENFKRPSSTPSTGGSRVYT
jgi:predicted phage terminase large subunit-like protein